jgi:hypothetical protein
MQLTAFLRFGAATRLLQCGRQNLGDWRLRLGIRLSAWPIMQSFFVYVLQCSRAPPLTETAYCPRKSNVYI